MRLWLGWSLATIVIGVLSAGLYCHDSMLNGDWIYDDGGTVTNNPFVLGLIPWHEVWYRDYWGKDGLQDPKSHKSFRPVTSATLRLNYMDAVRRHPDKTISNVVSYGFHVVNVVLHMLVSWLCLPAVYMGLGGKDEECDGMWLIVCEERSDNGSKMQDSSGLSRPTGTQGSILREGMEKMATTTTTTTTTTTQAVTKAWMTKKHEGSSAWSENVVPAMMTSVLFAVHPVHSEAVQNITGRAELLMALFYLLGFVVYAAVVSRSDRELPCKEADSATPVGRRQVDGSANITASMGLVALFKRPFGLSWTEWGALTVTMLCTVLALLSKEMGVTLPMFCSFWDYFVVQRLSLRHLDMLLPPWEPELGFRVQQCRREDDDAGNTGGERKIETTGKEDLSEEEIPSDTEVLYDEVDLDASDSENEKESAAGDATFSFMSSAGVRRTDVVWKVSFRDIETMHKAQALPVADMASTSSQAAGSREKEEIKRQGATAAPPRKATTVSRRRVARRCYLPAKPRLLRWFKRTFVMAIATGALCIWRERKNGGNPPMFRYNANRFALEPYDGTVPLELTVGDDSGVHGIERWLGMAYLWFHYAFHACAVPLHLAADWSGPCLALVRWRRRRSPVPLQPRTQQQFAPQEPSDESLSYLDIYNGPVFPSAFPTAFTSSAIDARFDPSPLFSESPTRSSHLRSMQLRELDWRVPIAIAFLAVVTLAIARWGCGRSTRPRVMISIGFFAFPFLLSTNIFLAVGTTIAERCIYLPSLGVCVGYALLFSSDFSYSPNLLLRSYPPLPHNRRLHTRIRSQFCDKGTSDRNRKISRRGIRFWGPRLAVFLLLSGLFSIKCFERNVAWTSQVGLWQSAVDTHGGIPLLDRHRQSTNGSVSGEEEQQQEKEQNTYSAHTAQNLAINLSVKGERSSLEQAAAALNVVRELLPEEDRVDTDEMYPTLALTLRLVGRWGEALEVLSEGWHRITLRESALRRGIKLWHMHALEPSIEQIPIRRGRLLAAQATTLGHVDLVEACKAMIAATRLAPTDSVTRRLAQDLEEYVRRGYMRYMAESNGNTEKQEQQQQQKEGASIPQPPSQTIAYQLYMASLSRQQHQQQQVDKGEREHEKPVDV